MYSCTQSLHPIFSPNPPSQRTLSPPPQRRLRSAVFLREVIPWWFGPSGYVSLAILSTIFIPMVYTPVKWYYVLVAYLITPIFALPNSYGCGLTDWDMSSMYAKLALFVFAAWAGVEVRYVCLCVYVR